MTDIFRAVRERVSAADAARHYGLTFDRKGWALCPFHPDRRPSMSFRDGRYRCWSCNASGDSIDFTGRLLGLDALGAVRRLNADFALALPLDRQPTHEEQREARRKAEIARAHQNFEEWRSGFIGRLNAAYREAHLLLKDFPDELTERQAVALRMQAAFEYWADMLTNGTPQDQAQIYKERGEISRWIDKALKD